MQCRLQIQLTLFLKELGLSVHDALLLWKREYSVPASRSTGNCQHGWQGNERRYIYNIRHLYGLEGSRINYRAHSCSTIQGRSLSSGDAGGCPFISLDSSSRVTSPSSTNINLSNTDLTQRTVQNPQCSQACQRFMLQKLCQAREKQNGERPHSHVERLDHFTEVRNSKFTATSSKTDNGGNSRQMPEPPSHKNSDSWGCRTNAGLERVNWKMTRVIEFERDSVVYLKDLNSHKHWSGNRNRTVCFEKFSREDVPDCINSPSERHKEQVCKKCNHAHGKHPDIGSESRHFCGIDMCQRLQIEKVGETIQETDLAVAHIRKSDSLSNVVIDYPNSRVETCDTEISTKLGHCSYCQNNYSFVHAGTPNENWQNKSLYQTTSRKDNSLHTTLTNDSTLTRKDNSIHTTLTRKDNSIRTTLTRKDNSIHTTLTRKDNSIHTTLTVDKKVIQDSSFVPEKTSSASWQDESSYETVSSRDSSVHPTLVCDNKVIPVSEFTYKDNVSANNSHNCQCMLNTCSFLKGHKKPAGIVVDLRSSSDVEHKQRKRDILFDVPPFRFPNKDWFHTHLGQLSMEPCTSTSSDKANRDVRKGQRVECDCNYGWGEVNTEQCEVESTGNKRCIDNKIDVDSDDSIGSEDLFEDSENPTVSCHQHGDTSPPSKCSRLDLTL